MTLIGVEKITNSFDEKTFVPDENTNWNYISKYQKLSEKFIEKHSDKVNWYDISKYQKLSEQFIEKHSDKVDWYYISSYQKLSEKFIEKYSDKVDWNYISEYQNLSETFIEKHFDKVDWYYISIYQKLSEKFIEKHNLTIPKTCWLYKTKEEKLEYIRDNTNYEVIDNQYIIAYKSTRIDGTSVFNNQYQYKSGKTYESHCDCNINNENSFGLSAWTKEKALEYYSNGKLFKVKIDINDIGCFVQEDGKIRCWKLTILEEVV